MGNEELSKRLDNLEADRVATLIVLTALIKTHPDKTKLHLQMTSLLEQQLGHGAALGSTLNDEQQERMRDFVEWLGAL